MLNFEIFNVYKTPIVAVLARKNCKIILLKVQKLKGVEFINIEYNKTLSEASVFKNLKDTVWLES